MVVPIGEAAGQNAGRGRLNLWWSGGPERRIKILEQHVPLRALFPYERDGADAVVVNSSGGVVGGDRLEVQVGVEDGTSALVTTQAAEKVYRSAGPWAEMDTRLHAGDGAVLAWLPQETILFEGCRIRRTIWADLHPAAMFLGAEMLVFGRIARGERLDAATVREAWEVRINGRLVWADRFRLDPPNGDIMDAPAGGGGGRALATVVFAGPEAFTFLDSARATLVTQPGVRAGVTMVNGLLIGRFLGADASKVRLALAGSLAAWRGVLLGQPARLPRLWAI